MAHNNVPASTLDTLDNLSLEELKQKRKEAMSKGDLDEVSKISEHIRKTSASANTPDRAALEKELQKAIDEDDEASIDALTKKLQNIKNTANTLKDPMGQIKAILAKDPIWADEKDQIEKLLSEHQRSWEQKQSTLGQKPKNALLNDLYGKLLDHDTEAKDMSKEKIGKAHNSVLPFIPYLRFKDSEERKRLRAAGILTINPGQIEVLGVKRWILRGRMNRVGKYFNELSDSAEDTDKAMNYIFSMSKKRKWGRGGAVLNRSWRKFLESKDIMRNPDKFAKTLEQKKKDFLDGITGGVEQVEEQEIMKSIKERLDFYIQNYRILQAKKWL